MVFPSLLLPRDCRDPPKEVWKRVTAVLREPAAHPWEDVHASPKRRTPDNHLRANKPSTHAWEGWTAPAA